MSYDRKALKGKARGHLKRHYLRLAILCAVSIFLGTEFNEVVTNAQAWYDVLSGQQVRLDLVGIRDKKTGNSRIIDDLIDDNLEAGRAEAA